MGKKVIIISSSPRKDGNSDTQMLQATFEAIRGCARDCFEGEYNKIWLAIQDNDELTAVVRSRQLHIYRSGKKVLVLAGKSQPKIIREDSLNTLLNK